MPAEHLVVTASRQIHEMGSAFYFAKPTVARGRELGLDAAHFYFLGRGGVLGDVEPAVVQSAFGYFAPGLVAHVWHAARAVLAPREAAREYFECCAAFGRASFGGLEDLAAFCSAAEEVNRAVHPAGLALYAGISAEPLAEDLPGRAMQLVTVLREFLGSAHLVAVVAVLLEPRVAHYLRRPEDFALFGYGEDLVPEVTEEDRRKLAAADELTERLVIPAFSVLDDAGAHALASGLDAMEAALAT